MSESEGCFRSARGGSGPFSAPRAANGSDGDVAVSSSETSDRPTPWTGDCLDVEGARRMLAAALKAEVDQYMSSWPPRPTGLGAAWWFETAITGPAP